MKIHFINVGYGEAILVERNGYTILIDGGTGREEEYEAPGCIRAVDYLKKAGIERLDLIIATHIHDDHIGGIPEVIRNFDVDQIWINVKPGKMDMDKLERFETVIAGNLSSTLFRNALASYGELIDECGKRGIPILQKGKEDGSFAPQKDFTIELLSPDGELQAEVLDLYRRLLEETDLKNAEALFREIDKGTNRSSISLRIKAGNAAAMLSGDKVDGWEDIHTEYGNALESQILKLTHHGQKDGMPQAMIAVSQPQFFVICASSDRRFNSAHPEIIQRANDYLRERGRKGGVYITGCLKPGGEKLPQHGGEICSVWFSCNEETGEISTGYTAL